MLDQWICEAGELFDSVIVNNSMPINDMPPLQQIALYKSINKDILEYWKNSKSTLIAAARSELIAAIESCSIPSQIELENA